MTFKIQSLKTVILSLKFQGANYYVNNKQNAITLKLFIKIITGNFEQVILAATKSDKKTIKTSAASFKHAGNYDG